MFLNNVCGASGLGGHAWKPALSITLRTACPPEAVIAMIGTLPRTPEGGDLHAKSQARLLFGAELFHLTAKSGMNSRSYMPPRSNPASSKLTMNPKKWLGCPFHRQSSCHSPNHSRAG